MGEVSEEQQVEIVLFASSEKVFDNSNNFSEGQKGL